MYCRVSFKVYTNLMADIDIYDFIDFLGVEAGITDGCLYLGLMEKNTDENFLLSHFICESLSTIFDKNDKIISLKEKYNCSYELFVKFSNIEEEIKNKTSFEINDEIKSFISDLDVYYNLNDDYFN